MPVSVRISDQITITKWLEPAKLNMPGAWFWVHAEVIRDHLVYACTTGYLTHSHESVYRVDHPDMTSYVTFSLADVQAIWVKGDHICDIEISYS